MKRLPVLPTILVAVAVAAMVALGVWQLQRRHEKLALIARLEANRDLPPIALPRFPDDAVLFRRAAAFCLQPVAWHREAGRAADGGVGWRLIADCRTGAEGPGFAVQLGVAASPDVQPAWHGGRISGYIARTPNHRPLIAGVIGAAPQQTMLVADTPLPGLRPNPPADVSAIPNNHLGYAIQWFVFAGVAVVIYAVALWRRGRPVVASPPRG